MTFYLFVYLFYSSHFKHILQSRLLSLKNYWVDFRTSCHFQLLQIYVVFVLNFIFNSSFLLFCHLKILFLFPSNPELKETDASVFETCHLPISSKFCVLQCIKMHQWERKSYTCFFINRFYCRFLCWLVATDFLANRHILCVMSVPVIWSTCISSSGGAMGPPHGTVP